MPQTTKTFRVFVSSTFTDMGVERRILQEEVFPKLRALCESKGASFQDVDLRWGVNEDVQLDQKTMDICLGEIARCQRLSPKPNFIILLGDKYGWQPIPARMPSSEMGLILRQVEKNEKELIHRWYREDLNALPPEYVLQPREGDYLPYEAWAPTEARLRDSLRKAVAKLPFMEDQKIKYFASATHQEIMSGAITPPSGVIDPEEHVFAYLRTLRGLPEDDTARDYIDLSSSNRDPYCTAQLEKLKKDLRAKLPQEHVYAYGASWDTGFILDDAKAFGERVHADLVSVIEIQLGDLGDIDIDPAAIEIRKQEEFKTQRLEHFTGRQEALHSVADYLKSTGDKVFSIIGASGTGKTSLLAKVIEETCVYEGVRVFRFLGTTSETSDTFQLLSGLIREIASAYRTEINALLREGEDETRFSTLKGLQEIFSRCLSLAAEEKPLLIFLDAIDQLGRDYTNLPFDWIPKTIPKDVKIVVSALPELREELSHTVTYELGAMPVVDATELLGKWLASVSRTLQLHQEQEVIEKFAANGTPLYLKLAFEEAKRWHLYSADITLKADIDGILDGYFKGLEKDHGSFLIQKVCGYLLSGKYQGLMEQEILDLLVFDKGYWNHFLTHCHPAHRHEVEQMGKLPIVVWSRLFLDMEPNLTSRDADGLPIICFYHRNFINYTRARYLTGPLSYHNTLAEYYENTLLYLDEKEERPDVRKVVEQPYQEALSEKWTHIADKTLSHFPFLMAKTKADMVEGILDDYAFLWDRAPKHLKEHLDLWRTFFTERIHILRRGNLEWPAYKILLQLAAEHADGSPIATGAGEFLKQGIVDWVWIRQQSKTDEGGISSRFVTLEGHTNSVCGALEMTDGRILSWAADHTLRIWDHKGRCLVELEGHSREIENAYVFPDGRILSWSSAGIIIWENWGRIIAGREWHHTVIAMVELSSGKIMSRPGDDGELGLSDGRILAWGPDYDYAIRLWEPNKGSFRTLEPQEGAAITFSDGRILSWMCWKSETLRLWDHQGKLLTTMKQHSETVTGVSVLPGGIILSRSYDHVYMWDIDGSFLNVFPRRLEYFGSEPTIVLSDGRILSWSGSDLCVMDPEKESAAGERHSRHSVYGFVVLCDERVLSWSNDTTLSLWDQQRKYIVYMSGHTGPVCGAIELKDGHILSWAEDHTLRLWNKEGIATEVFQRHKSSITKVLELSNKRILSMATDRDEDMGYTVDIWDQEGRLVFVLEGIKNAIEISGGKILSWARPQNDHEGEFDKNDLNNHSLRLWDQEGKLLAVFEGHRSDVGSAIELTNGKILSWTCPENDALPDSVETDLNDYALRLWDQEGKPLTVFEGHGGAVANAIELFDGKILSWGSRPLELKTLRLWDQQGTLLATFDEHSEDVAGAMQLINGNIVTWSPTNKFFPDPSLYLWNNEGMHLATFRISKALLLLSEFRAIYFGKKCVSSNCVLSVEKRTASINSFAAGKVYHFYWHGFSECNPYSLGRDGRIILTHAGQVCFLQIYHGNIPISVKELERLYDVDNGDAPAPSAPKGDTL